MTRRTLRALAVALAAIATGAPAMAQDSAPPAYSARAMHKLPDGSMRSGLVVKSGPDMRLEYEDGGQQVIQIIRRAEGLMLMLDPARQAFIEMRGTPAADPGASGYMPPCAENDPALDCRFTGTEVSSGITAEAWEVTRRDQPGQATKILWDGARHKALRQEMPDGSVIQLTFEAMDAVSGRPAERWAVAMTAPGQAPMAGQWFYDPELRVEIREVAANGEERWLEDIKVGPVDPAAFTVPAGWSRIEAPQVPAGGQAPPGSGN